MLSEVPMLGFFELKIMLSVKALREEAYGLKIREHIGMYSKVPSTAQTYTALKTLERKGLIQNDPARSHDGKRSNPRIYVLTVKGQSELATTTTQALFKRLCRNR